MLLNLLPKLAFDSALAQAVFPWFAGITFLAFLAIQADLVRATVRWFCPVVEPTTAQETQECNLQRGAEILWTVLPLLGTLLLALWLVIVG